jgi:hypothetical protein
MNNIITASRLTLDAIFNLLICIQKQEAFWVGSLFILE